jgi:hypothetical protein
MNYVMGDFEGGLGSSVILRDIPFNTNLIPGVPPIGRRVSNGLAIPPATPLYRSPSTSRTNVFSTPLRPSIETKPVSNTQVIKPVLVTLPAKLPDFQKVPDKKPETITSPAILIQPGQTTEPSRSVTVSSQEIKSTKQDGNIFAVGLVGAGIAYMMMK